ncbi:A/G-specific adenine glycosylase [Vampirovibrio sp.]|uniref:A/G-specific adenine glycosylase n=1 Tax=Vampirovibrio sp. TaxID=2717857 RepID=UPI0035930EB2
MTHPLISKPGFANALTDWYKADHRQLPWRDTTDPYAIWLSEIMLQQTQVKTVLDYYRRFLAQYPTISALAQAPPDQVLKLWEGLGYYARCRNLQKAAQQMVEKHNGQFPQTLAEAEALPGIGRSTAGAILTFAYGQKHPLLDGNVKRVISRLYDVDQDIQKTAVIHQMWQASEELLAESTEPHLFNQAMMELGATLCSPQNPRCLLCPVKRFCDACAHGTQHERPVKAPKKATPHHTIAVGIIWNDHQVLIQQRPENGLLGGLWEFPGGKQEPEETLEQTVFREIKEELGIEVTVGEKITAVKHAYTHFKITLHAYHCAYLGGEPKSLASQGWQWVSPDALEQFAFPKANKTVLTQLLNDWQNNPVPPVIDGSKAECALLPS